MLLIQKLTGRYCIFKPSWSISPVSIKHPQCFCVLFLLIIKHEHCSKPSARLTLTRERKSCWFFSHELWYIDFKSLKLWEFCYSWFIHTNLNMNFDRTEFLSPPDQFGFSLPLPSMPRGMHKLCNTTTLDFDWGSVWSTTDPQLQIRLIIFFQGFWFSVTYNYVENRILMKMYNSNENIKEWNWQTQKNLR